MRHGEIHNVTVCCASLLRQTDENACICTTEPRLLSVHAAGPGQVAWEALTTVVSTEFLKFAAASPSSSSGDLKSAGCCEVRRRSRASPALMCICKYQHFVETRRGMNVHSQKGCQCFDCLQSILPDAHCFPSGGSQQRRLRVLLLLPGHIGSRGGRSGGRRRRAPDAAPPAQPGCQPRTGSRAPAARRSRRSQVLK